VNIQFADDGIGFNVQEKLNLQTIGLTNILSRVKFLNGTVEIESSAGKGCNFFIQVPNISGNVKKYDLL
jgi:two-component system, NarL family, sensor kinase